MNEQIISGRFEIISELGRGGQGAVYLAHDTQLDRKVAIKTMRKFGQQTDQLTREALIVSKLQHPNIITLHDAGNHNGTPYLVYAYIAGKTLAQLIKEEKTLPFTRAAEIACDMLEGLAFAHMQGITHLDIKPANIMIAKSGLAMVMDFGLATTNNTNEQSETGMLNGSPRYVAPENISGLHGTPLSDIYAVGAVLYEMVTGHYAVTGENLYEVLNRAAHAQVIAPSAHNEQIDEKLEAIILKALEKDPSKRYPDALAMLKDIKGHLSESRSATLEFLLQRMRSKRDFPAISNVISEINAIVASDTRSTSQLVSAILQDLALANKILRVVNTAAFAKYGSIKTISKAATILGFETVRSIAMSLILLELLQNQPQAGQLKEEIIKGLLAGTIAAQLSSNKNISDAEEVQVCSMFHNLGKMLSTYYFFDESEEIAALAGQGESEEIAAARVLGIPYSELGMSVARNWKFPPRLLSGMRHLPDGKLPAPRGELEQLSTIVNLAYELCNISTSANAEDKPQQLLELSARYENSGVSPEELSSALDAGLAGLGDRARLLGIGISSSPALSRSRLWSDHSLTAPPQKIEVSADSGLDPGQPISPEIDVIEPPAINPEEILGAGIQDVTNTMMGEYRLNDVLQMVLETMHRGMGFHRTLFMIRNNKLGRMAARFGIGPGIDEAIPNFNFSLRFIPDVFHIAIEKGVDISITDIRALNIAEKIPAWYLDSVNAPSFILLPMMLDGKSIGLIYADMQDSNQLDISRQQLSLLRTLRNQAVTAVQQKT